MESCKKNVSLVSSCSSSTSSARKDLSLEQRRRIDQNFRAAKAILCRKRPFVEASSSPPCHLPQTWAPLPAVDRIHSKPELNQEVQSTPSVAASKACKSHDAQSILKTSYLATMCTPPRSLLAAELNSDFEMQKAFSEAERLQRNVQKSHPTCLVSSDTTRVSSDSRMPDENTQFMAGTNQGLLPLHIEKALIPDSDLDENMLMQLDSLCSARVPLMELSTNRPPRQSPSLLSLEGSQLSCSSMKSNPGTAILLATTEDHVYKPYPTSCSRVDSVKASRTVASGEASLFTSSVKFNLQEIVSSEADAKNDGLELLNQSCIESISHLDSKVPEQQEIMDNLQVDNGLSISCQNSDADYKPDSSSETDILLHMASSIVKTAAEHVSLSPSILESCSSEVSYNGLKMTPAYLQALNDTQREAVLSDMEKPLLILAGPGSGKTSTMVARLLRLLSEGVQATNILAMTFTTAAATEMKERVGAHVGKLGSKELNVCTFHSFCLHLCRSNAEKLGRSPDFLVYGHGQQRRAVIEATRLALSDFLSSEDGASVVGAPNMSIDSSTDQLGDPRLLKERAKKWDKFVTQAKASGRTPEYFEKLGNMSGAAILKHYNATLASCDALDYHDFINCSVTLLRDNDEVRKECSSKWTCLLVDEFQDTSKMQYELLWLLGSHKRITVVGDDDQSIFSFNGADSNNFEAFRKDFFDLKEVRLQHNYRSTRCIVDAAAALIGNNIKRCEDKQAVTDNDKGEDISVKECRNADAQCCFAIDTIIMKAQQISPNKFNYDNFAILYRRQVTGKVFQTALRSRKIPFNVHGVAFYRKKIVKTVISMLWTALDGDAIYCSRVFKALFGNDRMEAKKVVEYVEKVAKASQIDFLEAARSVFTAKVSGMFSRRQLACGRKVLSVIDAIRKLVRKEPTLSIIVTTVVNLIPQRGAFQKRAVLDVDEGKYLNEDDDPRTVIEHLLDDVTGFLGIHFNSKGVLKPTFSEEGGCLQQLKSFLDHVTLREHGNFKTRREDNKNSVTLTTLHQSKGLEWDTVFIVNANDSEIPLLHEARGNVCDGAMSIEEERRLFYVGMTRAKRKLYILYITLDSNQQLLRPTRFLKELPSHLLDYQVVNGMHYAVCPPSLDRDRHQQQQLPLDSNVGLKLQQDVTHSNKMIPRGEEDIGPMNRSSGSKCFEMEFGTSTDFLKGFNVDARSTIASIFHSWAKKPAFQDPKRLLNKVSCVLDERMCSKTSKNKDTLRAFKCCLDSDDALLYAQHVLKWMQIPQEERIVMLSEKQEFFQQKCADRSMAAAAATSKQVSYLRNLGCTIEPTSRLHASKLIEQYKKL